MQGILPAVTVERGPYVDYHESILFQGCFMRTETISYLKRHAASLELDEPMVITQSGKPVYRIESEQQAQLRDEGIALLKLMNLAERDIRSGATLDATQAKARLRERFEAGKAKLDESD